MNRLTDNDKKFGPLTIAKSSWKRFSIILSSDVDEAEGVGLNTLTIYAFGWILRLNLPRIIKPHAEKVIAVGWSEEDINRMGRNYYFNYFDRRYGFSLSDGDFFQLYYGIYAGFGNIPEGFEEQSWCKHLPWKMWDCVRHSIYNPDGSHFYTEKKKQWNELCEMTEKVPKKEFLFQDYDGKIITASCHIEEREWHRGEGNFKWMKHFFRPKIRRDLYIRFSEEVGPGKGSWKGGTLGHSIEMFLNETPKDAFRRYCSLDHERKGRKFELKFLRAVENA